MTLTLKDINFNIAMYGTEPVVQSTYSVVYTGDESSVKVNFNVTDETDLTGATAKVHLYFADSSHIEKDAQIDGTVVHYTLKGTENDHAGPVRVDVFITMNGATYTRAGYKFRIDQSLEASAPLVEYAIETLDTVIEGADEWLAQAQTDFGTAQNQRAAEWVADNDTRDDQFTAAQVSRTESFGQSETDRTVAFNASETGRSNTFTTNENARQAAADANETARNNSYTVAENDREERYGIAESNRSATADADHTRAVGDHNTATADHGIAESDHVTATADHENYAGLLEDGVLTTQIVDKLTELETTYASDLVSVKQQLAEGVVERKSNLYSASYDTEKESIKDIVYYQAHMKNPIGEVYTNVPVELKITFTPGECKNASCLVVKKSDGTVLEHQWASEINPNPFLTSNLATYPDGSLKNGSLYFMDSLTAIEEKIYTIEVHQVEQANSFTDKISLVIDSSNPANVKDKLSANGILLQFEQIQNYWLRYIYKDAVIISDSSAMGHKMWYSDKDNISCHVESANMTLVSKTLSGSGVVFKDYDFEWKRISNESIRYYAKVRMFSDGSFRIDAKIQFKDGMPVGDEIRAVGFSTNLAGVATADTNGIVTDKLIAQAYNSQMYRDIIDQSITYNVRVSEVTTSPSSLSLTWSSTLLKVIPTGSLFTSSFAFSSTNMNHNVMMNRLTVVATKKSKVELRKNVLRLSKKFYDFMHSNVLDEGTAFPALNHFNRLANGVLNGNLLIVDANDLDGQIAINNYIAALESTYQSFTLDGLKNVYQGIGASERGLEYIGRDTAPLKYMVKACEITGKTTSMSKLIGFVHVLADFYVWVEVLSGSNGSIRLHHNDIDNYNAEATALKALSYSLSFEANASRQFTFDRILSRFNGNIQYKTMLPYHTASNLVIFPMGHYSNFTLFEYPTVTFDTMSYINQYVSPSGKLKEIGFNESHRHGFYHSSLYAVYMAYRYDTISSLQLAVNLLENILSQCLPSGSKIFPLDKWVAPTNTIDGPVETQVVATLLLDEIL